jgi:predicted DNA-binding antitoxin AbrB/MazE fold protein
MTIGVDATYENGVLKLDHPIQIADKTRVHVTIEAPAGSGASDDPTGWKTLDRLIGSIEDTAPGEAIGRNHDDHLYK